MRKLINARMPLFMAVAFILGIFSCFEWYFGDFYFGATVVILLVTLLVIFVKTQSGVRKIAFLMLFFVIMGYGITRLNVYSMQKREVTDVPVTVTGRVCDLNRNRSEFNSTYYLEECVLSDGKRLRGRVQVTVYNMELSTGDVVTVSGELSSTYPIKSQVKSYLIRDSINYEMTEVTVVLQQTGNLKLDEKVRKYIYDITHDYMLQNGDVMYALLTGDSGAISNEINYVFLRAGILHLLAVSGLHVGFIVALICFALRRLHLHPLIECGIVVVPLLFYAYVCAFTPSVMRAIAMVGCSYVAKARFDRYDMLSSISWAALLILLVQPFCLFDVGFQLSFLSVYGIATMYATVNRWLNRRNINKYLRYIFNSFILSLSCVVATVFTVAINFGEIPVFSALLNLIAIPLVSVAFTLGIFGLIPSVFHYLLLAADYVLRVVVWCAREVSQISFATVVIYAVSISTVILIIVLFVFGGFVNVNRLGKRIFYPICAILLALSIIFAVIPTSVRRNQAFLSVDDNSAVVAAVSTSGEAALVTDFNEYYTLYCAVNYLRRFNITKCTVYISDCFGAAAPSLDVLASLPIDKVYLLATDDSETMEKAFAERGVSVIRQLPNSTTGSNIKVQSHYGAGLVGVTVTVDEMDICVAYGSERIVSDLLTSGISADVYVLPEANAAFSERNALTVTPYQSNLPYNYGANKYGNFTNMQKGVKIYLSFR